MDKEVGCGVNTISICVWRRADYTREVLRALRNCVGIENYKVLIHVDGGDDKGRRQFGRWLDRTRISFNHEIIKADRHLGCNGNTKAALDHGFSLSDYHIHLEDDTVPAPDALKYFEWANRFEHLQWLFAVCGWTIDETLTDMKKVGAWSFFGCWGWATWKSRWMEISANWTTGSDQLLSWDTKTTMTMAGRKCLLPHVSRFNNIGKKNGTHRCDSPLKFWAGSRQAVMPNEYLFVP